MTTRRKPSRILYAFMFPLNPGSIHRLNVVLSVFVERVLELLFVMLYLTVSVGGRQHEEGFTDVGAISNLLHEFLTIVRHIHCIQTVSGLWLNEYGFGKMLLNPYQ